MADPGVKGQPRTIGSGTLQDPEVIWMCCPPTNTGSKVDANEVLAAEAARIEGFTHVWIRHFDHNTTNARVNGRRVLSQWDMHITVYMGTGRHCATRQGHVYVVSVDNVPQRFMELHERRYPRGGPIIDLHPYP